MKIIKHMPYCAVILLALYGCGSGSGNNSNGIANLTIVKTAAGRYLSAAILSDGSLWRWGMEPTDDGSRDIVEPEKEAGLKNVATVSAGDFFAALKNDGTVWSWGSQYWMDLGTGSFDVSYDPSQVINLASIVDIDVGREHGIVLDSDGKVWTWGCNSSAQRGDDVQTTGPEYYHDFEARQLNTLPEIKAVSAGDYFSIALDSDGKIWYWGALGTSSSDEMAEVEEPKLIDGIDDVKAISAGTGYFLALKEDGTVWGWGKGDYCQLGDGISDFGHDVEIPVQTESLGNVIAVAASYSLSLALKDDGTLWAWGAGYYGMGNSGEMNCVPTKIEGLEPVAQIAESSNHILALKSDGTLWAWGENEAGQLGNGTTEDSLVPVQVQFPE